MNLLPIDENSAEGWHKHPLWCIPSKDSGKPVSMRGADICTFSDKEKQMLVINGFRELGWQIKYEDIPDATFYIWLPIPPKYKTSQEFTSDVLRTSGILLVPGSAFGKNGEGFFRLSAVADDQQLNETIYRLKQDGFYFNN